MITQQTAHQIRDEAINELRKVLRALKVAGKIAKYEVTKNKALRSPYGNKHKVKIMRYPTDDRLGQGIALQEFVRLYVPSDANQSVGQLSRHGAMNPVLTMVIDEDVKASAARTGEERIPKFANALPLLSKMVAAEKFSRTQALDHSGVKVNVCHVIKSYL